MSPYVTSRTALIIIDPYNDFMSARGKMWPLVGKVTKQLKTIPNMERIVSAARARGIQIAYAPHRRYVSGILDDRKYLTTLQLGQKRLGVFGEGKFGGTFHERFLPHEEDLISSPHACSSGFAETNLHDQLSARGITHIILVGYTSNTCIEATARSAVDLDYHVTLVTDAVATFTPEDHQAAVGVSYHQLAQTLTQTERLVGLLSQEGVAHV